MYNSLCSFNKKQLRLFQMGKDRLMDFAGTKELKGSTEVQGIKAFQNEMPYVK